MAKIDEHALEREKHRRERQARTARYASQSSPVLVLLVVLATAGIIGYAWFLLRPGARGDLLPYSLVIIAEGILITQALFSMWTILSGGQNPRDYAYYAAQRELFPTGSAHTRMRMNRRKVRVDVFITCYGEDVHKIRATATAARAMTGEHRTWILDDGRSDEVRDLANELDVNYVRRLSSGGAKAGNINHALTIAKGEFFVVLDADFVPRPEFLVETLPFMVDDTVAFVQTPQTYGNLDTIIARGAAYMQAVFYRFVQPGRNRFNAAFCVGTNVLFRRSAVESVGGIYTGSKSEDVWTSLLLHERGWRSVYIPEVLATGDAPDSVEGYSKQQLRWAMGGFEILFTSFPFSPRRKLTMDQRLQYFVTATFYLTGICPLLLLLVPPLEIYFDLRPISLDMSVGQWAFFYAGFYLMQVLLAWFVMGSFRWETLTLATASFPIYTKALWNVITGKDVGWHVTGSGGTARSPLNFMIPQVLFFFFLLLTTFVAIIRDLDNGVFTLATAWNGLNTAVLALFITAALRDARPRGRRALPMSTAAVGEETRPETLVVARPPAPELTTLHTPTPEPATDRPTREAEEVPVP